MPTVSEFLNERLKDKTPTQLVLMTVGATVAVRFTADALGEGRLLKRAYKTLWRGIRFVAGPAIMSVVRKASKDIKLPSNETQFKAIKLPETSRSEAEVLELVQIAHQNLDVPYEDGSFSGAVYHGGADHTKFINDVMAVFQWSNPLHSDIFGATRQMEAEIVSMVVSMFHGDLLPDACGCVTSGGTESIMMAMKTYRDWARSTRGFKRPSIVAPITAHPAFDKAAEYFDLELIKVPVCPPTMRVDPKELEKYIRYDTVAIVGSAPNFPHGVVDDIEALSEIAYQHRIGMHVDCCLGGFIMPFLEKIGRQTFVVDFRNRGVTSISCDTHKYGYAPKGTSTVLYRTKELRSHQFCCVAEWPGGMYCSPAVSGSKPGNVIAGTWAAMVRMGLQGYVECARKIVTTRERMTDAIKANPFLYVIGEPTASVFAFGSDMIDIFELSARLRKRKWALNCLQFPSGLQFSVTLLQTNPGVVERFVKDVTEAVNELVESGKQGLAEGKRVRVNTTSGTMYGTSQRVPDRTIIQDVLREFLSTYYTA